MASLLRRWWSGPPPFAVQAASLTGPRDENQDNYLVIAADPAGQVTARWLADGAPQQGPRRQWPTHWVRLAVFDGMGGHRLGREIAEAAAAGLRDLPPCRGPQSQRRALFDLHRRLQGRFAAGPADRPGTTLVWAEIDRRDRCCHLLHLGDSRAWLIDTDAARRLTHDHTLAEFGFRDGRIDAAAHAIECDRPDQRLAQALGYGAWGVQRDGDGGEVFGFSPDLRLDAAATLPADRVDHADLKTFALPPGARLLLASDGLWSAPDPAALGAADAAATLAQAALDAGGTDNITLVLGGFPAETQTP